MSDLDLLVVLAQLTLNTPVAEQAAVATARQPVPLRHRVRETERIKAIELYRSGMSALRVAGELGIAKSTVLRVLHSADVKVRSRGHRHT